MTLGDRIAVLHDGALQQVAPPLELYRKPASVFVASFIGSPAMNFFRCDVVSDDAGPRLACASFDLHLEESAASGLSRGASILAGIRPHDVAIVAPDDAADAHGKITMVEPLGSELRVHLRLENADQSTQIIAVVAPDTRVTTDDRVGVRFAPDRLHLFDARSEQRL